MREATYGRGTAGAATLRRPIVALVLALTTICVATAAAEIGSPVEYVLNASGTTAPSRLPDGRPVAIALKVGFTSEALGSATTPELGRIAIELNQAIELNTEGLPSCPLSVVGSPTADPTKSCARSLVGRGVVDSEITLPGQAPVKVEGSLLAFYAFAEGAPRILARVVTGEPLPVVYVIPFEIHQAPRTLGTVLRVKKMHILHGICRTGFSNCFAQPYNLNGVYGRISSLQLTLHRSFAYDGQRASFAAAHCPHRASTSSNTFPLLRVTAHYAEQTATESTRSPVVSGSC